VEQVIDAGGAVDPTARSEPSFLECAGRVAPVDCRISRGTGFRAFGAQGGCLLKPTDKDAAVELLPKGRGREENERACTDADGGPERGRGACIGIMHYLHTIYTVCCRLWRVLPLLATLNTDSRLAVYVWTYLCMYLHTVSYILRTSHIRYLLCRWYSRGVFWRNSDTLNGWGISQINRTPAASTSREKTTAVLLRNYRTAWPGASNRHTHAPTRTHDVEQKC
jgi:hypothetical protein